MHTTTSRMNAESAFLRCMVTPKDGSTVTLHFSLPTTLQPVEIAGTVKQPFVAGSQARETGFWVVFDELRPEAREELESFLGSKGAWRTRSPAPARPALVEPPGSKRVFARVPARFEVRWASTHEFLVAYSENLSRGGIFVATSTPPALRETVELSLQLPDGKGLARTQAEVVQRVTVEQAGPHGVAGAGLQFVGSDDEFRQRLDACIEHLLTAL